MHRGPAPMHRSPATEPVPLEKILRRADRYWESILGVDDAMKELTDDDRVQFKLDPAGPLAEII